MKPRPDQILVTTLSYYEAWTRLDSSYHFKLLWSLNLTKYQFNFIYSNKLLQSLESDQLIVNFFILSKLLWSLESD